LILRDPNFEDNKFIVCTDCPQETYLTPTGNGSGLTGLTTSQITNLSSYTGLDVRYFTETETDVRYLRKDANNNYANLLRYTSSGSVHDDAVRSFYGTDSDFSVYFSAGTNSAVIDLISASSLIIRDNGTNRVEINDDGTVSGSDPVNSDDFVTKGYLESSGTFTATIIDDGGGATYSASTNLCSYYRVGELVFIQISIASINTTGAPSGNFSIGNLPFPVKTGQHSLNLSNFLGSSVSFYSIYPYAINTE